MSTVNEMVFQCVDEALTASNLDKATFYDYLKHEYKFDFDRFADDFRIVHKALEAVFGRNHYRIEREMIRILNERANQGVYERSKEITAFGSMVNVFIEETQKNLERQKSIHRLSEYTKQLEQKVKEADEKLKVAERMAAIGETAAMVGHDIRNPLQAIVGELYLEKEEVCSLPEGETRSNLLESIRAIEENIFYVNKIVSDLQDFARPLKAEEQEVDVNTVIADALSMVPIPSNLQVQIDVSSDFPMLNASNQMLKRALTNLVQNAVQAMPDGGQLTIKATANSGKGVIVVEDTGVGIPEEVKAHLFKPLITTKAKGQGLGLAVVKRLIEAQNGTVRFESEAGNGAKFIVEIPARNSFSK